MTDRRSVFISYSHRDRELMEELRTHLAPLGRRSLVDYWVDTKIGLGDAWHDEIMGGLERARVAVMLVSKNFLDSDFIMSREVPYLLEKAEKGEMEVYQVVLGRCCFNLYPELSRFQAVNNPTEPLRGMSEHDRDGVWVDLVQKIVKLLANLPQEATLTVPADSPVLGGERYEALSKQLTITTGDIVRQSVDAIVVSASRKMDGEEGGMERSVHRAAGPRLRKACAELGGVGVGQAKITSGFDLPAGNVIHVNVPWWAADGGEDLEKLLGNCYKNALRVATEQGLESIAFGALGTGSKGVPIHVAARVALNALGEALSQAPGVHASIVCGSAKDEAVYKQVLAELSPLVAH